MRYIIPGLPAGSQLYLGDKTGRFTVVASDGSFRAEPEEVPYLKGMGFKVESTTLTGDVVEIENWLDPAALPTIAKNQEAAAKVAAQYDKVPVPKRSK